MKKYMTILTIALFFTLDMHGQTPYEYAHFNQTSYSNTGQLSRPGSIRAWAFVVHEHNGYTDFWGGGHWYGLSLGDKNKLYFNTVRASSFRYPLYLNGFYGISFRTEFGKMTFMENGILTLGLDKPKIEELADNSFSNSFKMYVAGGIKTEQIVTDAPSNWPDYVFSPNYSLPSLGMVKEYIKNHGHLPDIPSELDVKKDGVNLAQMDAKLLKKVEELTLYLVQLDKKTKSLIEEYETLKNTK